MPNDIGINILNRHGLKLQFGSSSNLVNNLHRMAGLSTPADVGEQPHCLPAIPNVPIPRHLASICGLGIPTPWASLALALDPHHQEQSWSSAPPAPSFMPGLHCAAAHPLAPQHSRSTDMLPAPSRHTDIPPWSTALVFTTQRVPVNTKRVERVNTGCVTAFPGAEGLVNTLFAGQPSKPQQPTPHLQPSLFGVNYTMNRLLPSG